MCVVCVSVCVSENLDGREIERLETEVDGAHAVQTRHDQEDACKCTDNDFILYVFKQLQNPHTAQYFTICVYDRLRRVQYTNHCVAHL